MTTSSRGRPKLKVFKPADKNRKLLIRGKNAVNNENYTVVDNSNDLAFKSTLESLLSAYYENKIKLRELSDDARATIEYLLSRVQEKIDNDEDFAILLRLPLVITVTKDGIEAKELGK